MNNLDSNGELIGSPLEMKLRGTWRKVAKHHGMAPDGVVEADLVRGFLAALDAAEARVVVKPLVFADEYGDGILTSRETGKLKRVIPQNGGGFYASSLSTEVYPTAEAAVAAYQADHVAFVLRCLHPASPLSAVAMREKAAALFTIPEAKPVADRIRAIPTTFTPAELLAAAMELDEVKALVDAAALISAMNDNHAPFGGEIYQDRIARAWPALRAALAPFARKAGV